MKEMFKYPLIYLFTLVVVYSVYDYFEHISRAGSTFAEHPGYWLLFTFSGVASFILIVFLAKMGMERIFNRKNLSFEVAGIAIWLLLYIYLLGPMNDKLLWPFDELIFRLSFGPFFIILIVYFIIRLLANLIMGKKALYSR